MLILENFFDYFTSLDFWQIFSIGLGAATIVIIIIYAIVFFHLRSKRLKTHEVRIDLNGGIFQGSDEELLLKGAMGTEIDITRIRPVKEGYRFNGFNVYKKYVSSVIKEEGLSKSMVTKEELDGMDKSIIVMPDYDLTLVAKYSPLDTQPAVGLSTDIYYPDFLSFEDLVSELKHLNDDKVNWPDTINFKRSSSVSRALFIFRKDTICAILYPYKGVTKVFLRTSDATEEKLLTPFYQTEDINDAMNWYSFVVIYNTKPSRFIRTFKDAYDGIDASLPTTEIEFQLITSSFSNLADPVLDRAVLIVQRYENDKLLTPVPDYVINRELPPDLDENGEPRKFIPKEKPAEKIIEAAKAEVEQKIEKEPETVVVKPAPVIEEPKPVIVPEETVEEKAEETFTLFPYSSSSKFPEQRYFDLESVVVEGGSKDCFIKAPTIADGDLIGIYQKAVAEPVVADKPAPVVEKKSDKPLAPINIKPVEKVEEIPEVKAPKKKVEPISVSKPVAPGKKVIKPVDPRLVHVNFTPSSNKDEKKSVKPINYKPEDEGINKPIGPIGIKPVAGGAGLMTPVTKNPELGNALLKELKENPTTKEKKKKKGSKKSSKKATSKKKTAKK